MWGGTDERKAIEAIRASIDMGITSIDTAPVYGFGKSEELVGRAVAGRRDEVQIFTKFGLRGDIAEGEFFFHLNEDGGTDVYRNARKERIIEECERSLKCLNTDRIDLYQCHWRDHTTPVEETMEALIELHKAGKILAGGVSNFTAEEIDACRKVFPVASLQPPYSMVFRGIEADVLPYCRTNNVGVIVYSPMQRGLLTGKFSPEHKFAEGDSRAGDRFFQPENIRRVNRMLDEMRPLAAEHKATLAQLVINWTIRQPGITAALVGARDAAQARENAGALAFTLSDADLSAIDSLINNLVLE
jgi:aryl-alcohol dehydrogenase-like predicted oxidoreductase